LVESIDLRTRVRFDAQVDSPAELAFTDPEVRLAGCAETGDVVRRTLFGRHFHHHFVAKRCEGLEVEAQAPLAR
jgi:hypothetical protein